MSCATPSASDGIDSLADCFTSSLQILAGRIMSRYEDVVARVATRSDSSLNACKERLWWLGLRLGHERRGSQRSNFASFHPQNSSKGLDRSETPWTRDSAQLLSTRRRFEGHCKCDEMHAAASTAIANQVHDPTKTSLIVSEVDKGSLKGFQPWETLPRPFRMAVSKNVTHICG
jgi:hypothetical protein